MFDVACITPDKISVHGLPLTGVMNSEEVELMQFTGLKDKNGREIYEGDIVSNKSGVKYLIEYEEDGMRFIIRPSKWGITKKAVVRDGYEVIGNIYEHSHLLNK